MFKTLTNAFRIKDIRKKLLMTLLLILVYRVGCHIPIPGVNAQAIAQMVESFGALEYLNLFSGGALSQYTIFAMGISPYITGSIIMQLLQIAIPSLERMAKEEEGRKKLQQVTRYVGIALALVQSVGIILALGPGVVYNPGFFTYATIGIIATGGTAFLMWMGERITEYGVGNGISMLIFASIVSQVPTTIMKMWTSMQASGSLWLIPLILLFVVALITLVVYINEGVRRVPVQYAKRVVGRKQYGGQSTHIPMKVNANGVMPLIFAMTFMSLPVMIMQMTGSYQVVGDSVQMSGFAQFYTNYLGNGTIVYYVIYALLIIGFAYFYTTVSFNPIEMSKNLQQHGGFLPGIRPGRPTSDYLKRISSRLTMFGALFLAALAIVPSVLLHVAGIDRSAVSFGPTSVLIIVSVALETMDQLENQMLMRHYKGFLN